MQSKQNIGIYHYKRKRSIRRTYKFYFTKFLTHPKSHFYLLKNIYLIITVSTMVSFRDHLHTPAPFVLSTNNDHTYYFIMSDAQLYAQHIRDEAFFNLHQKRGHRINWEIYHMTKSVVAQRQLKGCHLILYTLE